MRIVHLTDYFHPVLGYHGTFLPREHARMGHEVYVVTSDRYNPRVYPPNRHLLGESRIKGAGFFTEEGAKVWRLKTLFEITEHPWLLGLEKKIQEIKPDIVRAVGVVSFTGIRIARLKQKIGGFKLLYDDGMTFETSRSKLRFLYHPFRWFFSDIIQKSADGLVSSAETSRVFMHQKYGIPLERIAIIPLGADDNYFNFDSSVRQEIRSQLSLDEKDMVFIYTGKSIPEKGPHLLIDAAIKLMKKGVPLKVLLVGGGHPPYVEEMKQEIEAEGVADSFIWHDAVPNKELYKYYSASDAAVWPYQSSISQMEAMACQLPVIISDDSEVTERVSYDNGLTYRGGDPSDLARQMEKLLDPELRTKMGQNGRKLIEERLSYKVIARQFIELVSP